MQFETLGIAFNKQPVRENFYFMENMNYTSVQHTNQFCATIRTGGGET